MDSAELSKIFSDSFYHAIFEFLKMFWPYLLALFILAIVSRIINERINIRNAKLRKQREQAEFERKVELYLKKKDEHEAKKRYRN